MGEPRSGAGLGGAGRGGAEGGSAGAGDHTGRLRRLLAAALPGHAAHRLALPPAMEIPSPPPGVVPRESAVLLTLHAEDGRARFPLIRRPASMARHAGQIALPGGVLEEGEGPVAGALREAHEEVGLDPSQVDILGRLTPVYIPVSRYRVHPVLGWARGEPRYRAQAEEVLQVLLADPDALVHAGPVARVRRERGGVVWSFPAYDVEGEPVWGATAQILAEFLQLWQRR